MISSNHHYLVEPLVTVVAMAVILLLCRWTFSAPKRPAQPAPVARSDYGLLVPVATAPTAEDAERLRTVLREASIRCTVTADADGAAVLVFRADALRARELVSG